MVVELVKGWGTGAQLGESQAGKGVKELGLNMGVEWFRGWEIWAQLLGLSRCG